jgi:hypothetical protein
MKYLTRNSKSCQGITFSDHRKSFRKTTSQFCAPTQAKVAAAGLVKVRYILFKGFRIKDFPKFGGP